jgi:hypothetical protein
MKKIDLENVQEFTKFKNPVGGFICEIKTVEDVPEKEYLKIGYDIAEALNNEQKEFVGMYEKRKKERDFDYPTTVVSYKENSLPFFKGFITALENSNRGYKWDNDETKFVGKLIGFVIGEEEYEGKDKNGVPKVKVRTYVAERHSVDAIKEGDFDVPEFKKLTKAPVERASNPFANNGAAPEKNPFDDIETPSVEDDNVFSTVEDDDCPF